MDTKTKFERLMTFKSLTHEIVGYELRNLTTLGIEYYYVDEINDTFEIEVERQTLPKQTLIEKILHTKKEIKGKEELRKETLYGLNKNNQLSEYSRINIQKIKLAVSVVLNSQMNNYICGLRYDRHEINSDNTFYILYRNVAFYNGDSIIFENKGKFIGILYTTFEADYNTAICLFKTRKGPSKFFRGTTDQVIDFIADIFTASKSKDDVKMKAKYRENTIRPDTDRVKVIHCILRSEEETYPPCGELVNR